jgi:branched-chain amino acid transport system permease protein
MTALLQQVINGIVSGSFYALLALGLTVIWGMLKFVNFAHGAVYMVGAFGAVYLSSSFGLSWWWALLIVPLVLGVIGAVVERTMVRRLLDEHHIYGFLFTFGVGMVVQDLIEGRYGVSAQPYGVPSALDGAVEIFGFRYPVYPLVIFATAVVLCVVVAVVLGRTRIGLVIRASIERPDVTRALGIHVGRWITPVFGAGIALAAFAGVLAAPMRAVASNMGTNIVIVLFAVVIIGGLGSIMGSVLAGFLVGIVQGIAAYFVPHASATMVFVLMAVVLLLRPNGLFGREEVHA